MEINHIEEPSNKYSSLARILSKPGSLTLLYLMANSPSVEINYDKLFQNFINSHIFEIISIPNQQYLDTLLNDFLSLSIINGPETRDNNSNYQLTSRGKALYKAIDELINTCEPINT